MKTILLLITLISASLVNAQNVYIPDLYFKSYLLNNPAINTNGDSEIQVSEAIVYNGGIYCSLIGISDLTGIEAFTALTYLDCEANQLTSLNVSNNTALIYLDCQNNQLASLDLSSNSALMELYCQGNELTSLDVSNNTALTSLHFDANQITTVDVSNNTALTELYCGINYLTSLDVSSNASLTALVCLQNQLTCLNVQNGNNTSFTSFFAGNNPNLSCIEVDNVAYSNANWTNIDAQTSFNTDCNNACSNTIGIDEISNTPTQLVNITDLMGRETKFKPNTPLLYIYSDGTIEKVFRVD